MKKIPFSEPWFSESYAEIVRDQIASGVVDSGLATAAFQEAISIRVRSRHTVMTTSGTAALSVAAIALGLKAGEEILVPAYGSVSTVNAFASIGLSPRMVDIDRSTGCMHPMSVEKKITSKTRAICFVDFSGYVGDPILTAKEICSDKGLFLLEDASSAFGQSFGKNFAGTFGRIGTFSFGASEILSTGQGGALVTDSEEYFRRAVNYIHQGNFDLRRTGKIETVGTNLRYNDILAAFGLGQLRDLEIRLGRKLNAHEVLKKALRNRIFQVPGNCPPKYNVVFTEERAKLLEVLRAQGIHAARLFGKICDHPAYAHLAEGSYPEADFWSERAVYLPCGLSLTIEDAARIAEAVLDSGIAIDPL